MMVLGEIYTEHAESAYAQRHLSYARREHLPLDGPGRNIHRARRECICTETETPQLRMPRAPTLRRQVRHHVVLVDHARRVRDVFPQKVGEILVADPRLAESEEVDGLGVGRRLVVDEL